MKILTVVCGLGIGGTERTAENFSIGLMRCGYDVKVYANTSSVYFDTERDADYREKE